MTYANCKDYKKTLIVDGYEVTDDCPGTVCAADQEGQLCHSRQDYAWYVCMNQTWQRHADVAPLTRLTCEDGIYGPCIVDKLAGTCSGNDFTNLGTRSFAQCRAACTTGAVHGKDCTRFKWSDYPYCVTVDTEDACTAPKDDGKNHCSWDAENNRCYRDFKRQPFDENSSGFCTLFSGEMSSEQTGSGHVNDVQTGNACYAATDSMATPSPSSPCSCATKVQSNPDMEVTVCTHENDNPCPHLEGYTAHPQKQGFQKVSNASWTFFGNNVSNGPANCASLCRSQGDGICPSFTLGYRLTPTNMELPLLPDDFKLELENESICAYISDATYTPSEAPPMYPNNNPVYLSCLYTKNTT